MFDRVWSLRSERLREGAALLSRDFGFREAVATGDSATIVSAMENLRRRFSIDRVFIVGFRNDLRLNWSFPKPTHSRAALLTEQWVTGRYWEKHRIPRPRRWAWSRSPSPCAGCHPC